MPYGWIGWSVLGAYLVGYIAEWRRAVWMVAHVDGEISHPQSHDWVAGICIGSVMATVWPIFAAGRILYSLQVPQKLAKPPKAQQFELKAREQEDRQRRIEQMERGLENSHNDS